MPKLSIALAVRNEEKNIESCLESIKEMIAGLPAQSGEIIVVDEESTDKTREVATKYGAKIIITKHEPIFHLTKQKALDNSRGDWILQLDADEIVSKELAQEIKKVISMNYGEIMSRKIDEKKNRLFSRHLEEVEKRDGKIGRKTGEVVAFFIPRKNFFLHKPLRYAGLYPDGVIRLVKNKKARFPGKSVHEQMVIDGEVAWLTNDLLHNDSPTLRKYFARLNRYTDLQAKELKEQKVPKNLFSMFDYVLLKPFYIFVNLFIRHKGILDGFRGFLWSMFSSWHYPIAYFKYYTDKS